MTRRWRMCWALALGLCLCLPASAALFAQESRGTILGRVADESDAAMPGVTVEVVNVEDRRGRQRGDERAGQLPGAAAQRRHLQGHLQPGGVLDPGEGRPHAARGGPVDGGRRDEGGRHLRVGHGHGRGARRSTPHRPRSARSSS